MNGEPYLKNRADGVDGHYCIARERTDGAHEYWSVSLGEWTSCGTLFELGPLPLMHPENLQVDSYGKHGVAITHKPTGVVICCDSERSQHKNRAKALEYLEKAFA